MCTFDNPEKYQCCEQCFTDRGNVSEVIEQVDLGEEEEETHVSLAAGGLSTDEPGENQINIYQYIF